MKAPQSILVSSQGFDQRWYLGICFRGEPNYDWGTDEELLPSSMSD